MSLMSRRPRKSKLKRELLLNVAFHASPYDSDHRNLAAVPRRESERRRRQLCERPSTPRQINRLSAPGTAQYVFLSPSKFNPQGGQADFAAKGHSCNESIGKFLLVPALLRHHQ